jgi:Protein of unknown function (DUF3667)
MRINTIRILFLITHNIYLLIPRKLTEAFFKGHRKRYIHPTNLFFVVGVILPFVAGKMWQNAAKENHMDKGFIKEKELYRNDLLFEMDSAGDFYTKPKVVFGFY